MKLLIATLLLAFMTPGTAVWLTDYNVAKTEAASNKKLVLISFSGSDWCGPCIRTRKEIFNTETFKDFAEERLVLVQADFPRAKKNQLSKDQVKKNEALADKYNPDGIFPLTLLVNSKGKILMQWKGFPNETPAQFVNDIKAIEKANK
jgi:thioredoxin-related protein